MYQSFQPEVNQLSTPCFQPFQIVCLERRHSSLYAEVIQTVEEKQVCWVRPLVLVEQSGLEIRSNQLNPSLPEDRSGIYDLRQGSDLLLPIALFRPALDTEIIPLLMGLEALADEESGGSQVASSKHLNQFVQGICREFPEAFSPR